MTLLTVVSAGAALDPSNKLIQFLLDLQKGLEPDQEYVIPEADLNEYLKHEAETRRISAVREISVRLYEGAFETDILVDADQLDLSDSMSGKLLGSMLSGDQEIFLRGTLTTQDRKILYETEAASLNGVELPPSMIDLLLRSLGQQQEPPIDPTRPVPLPTGVQDLQLLEGKVVIRS